MSVTVHFNTRPGKSNNRELIAIPEPGTGVLMMNCEAGKAFAAAHGFNFVPHDHIPKGVKVVNAATGETVDSLEPDENRPPVCYTVGEDLICW